MYNQVLREQKLSGIDKAMSKMHAVVCCKTLNIVSLSHALFHRIKPIRSLYIFSIKTRNYNLRLRKRQKQIEFLKKLSFKAILNIVIVRKVYA